MARFESPHALHFTCFTSEQQTKILRLLGGTRESVLQFLSGERVVAPREVVEVGYKSLGVDPEDELVTS